MITVEQIAKQLRAEAAAVPKAGWLTSEALARMLVGMAENIEQGQLPAHGMSPSNPARIHERYLQ